MIQEWNEIGRGDTLTNLDIAKATRNDGKQMRSIAMLTMIFLPATSVAVSSHILLQEENDTEKVRLSHRLCFL